MVTYFSFQHCYVLPQGLFQVASGSLASFDAARLPPEIDLVTDAVHACIPVHVAAESTGVQLNGALPSHHEAQIHFHASNQSTHPFHSLGLLNWDV